MGGPGDRAIQIAVAKHDVTIHDHSWEVSLKAPARGISAEMRVDFDELWLVADNMIAQHRQHFQVVDANTAGIEFPPRWSLKKALKSKHNPVRLLIVNGVGSGWGDVIAGSAALDAIYHRFRKAGKEIEITLLIRDDTIYRYMEIFRLRRSVKRIFNIAMPAKFIGRFHYVAATENILDLKIFQRGNFYDFWAKMLDVKLEGDKRASLYPNPRVAGEVAAWLIQHDFGLGEEPKPICLVNLFASQLREIPDTRWKDLITAVAKDFDVLLPGAWFHKKRLEQWLRHNDVPATNAIDLTERSLDHLIFLMEAADVTVSPDTSVVHIAGSMGAPCVGIFFTIEPDLRTRYMPSVTPYVAPEWRKGKYWGLSKVKGSDFHHEYGTFKENPEARTLWDRMDVDEVARLAREAMGKRTGSRIVSNVYVNTGAKRKVLAYIYQTQNFGDRLGFHLLTSVLPPDCELELAEMRSYEFRSLADVDLLVLGIGGSFWGSTVGQKDLATFVRAAKHSIGIFGTQYHSSIQPEYMSALVGSLDCWFARYHNDVDKYGGGSKNVKWLGDWTATMFPMTKWCLDSTTTITAKEAKHTAPDFLIRGIQQHRRVVSNKLHPLLCALCSADEVRYEEQKDMKSADGARIASGKFRAMLTDVFGKAPPPGRWFRVDRAKVAAYKKTVVANVEALRSYIWEVLQ